MSESILELLIGASALCLIIMALVLFVLTARKLLLLSGTARLIINDSAPISVALGQKLLLALTESGVNFPAACGGKGICGLCQINVTKGNSPLLPIESTHISSVQAAQGFRLACMLRIKGDLSVQVPEKYFSKNIQQCKVITNRLVSAYMTELTIEPIDNVDFTFEAGDYVLLTAPPCTIEWQQFAIPPSYLSEWEKFGLLNLEVKIEENELRAYSLSNAPSESNKIQLLVRIATPPANAPFGTTAGKVSSYIFSLKPGDIVSITGPFGSFHCRENDREMLFIGGGAGMAPLRAMIREQLLWKKSTRNISFWYGARNKQQLCYQTEFEQLAQSFANFNWHVALSESLEEDGWHGYAGFIHTVLLQEYLANHPAPQNIDYYVCGPPVMSSAVITMLLGLGVGADSIFNDDFVRGG